MTRGDAPSKTSHHTSGPWRASECLTVCQGGGGAIAQCFWVSGAIELEAAEANARLIAAAPEMYDACRTVAALAQNGADTIALLVELNRVAKQCAAAIAKAEGRE